MSSGVLPLSVPFDPTPVESLLRELVLSPDDLVVLALGVSWCYPTELTLRNLSAAATELKAKHVRVVLVDQERNLAFCAAHGINVGVATLHLYFRGRRLQVSRRSQPDVVDSFVGTLDQSQAIELLREAFAAITNNAPLTLSF